MTQEATVIRQLPGGRAEVSVSRKTACGGNCENCESCIVQNDLKVTAFNPISAPDGAAVVIESESSKIYKAIALVYIMPLLLFLAGYFISGLFASAEGIRIISSFAGLVLGGVIIVVSQKNKTQFKFTITRVIE